MVSGAVKRQIRFLRFSEIKLQKPSLDKPHTQYKSYWKEEMRSNFVKKILGETEENRTQPIHFLYDPHF